MEHVRFGRTGLQVSRLCLGTMTFGYQCDDATSFAIMDASDAAGITFIDTADVYPLGSPPAMVGRTEELVGQWLKGRRDDYVVATKCFYPTGTNAWERGSSRKNIMRSIDNSLRRLQTDYIDLYQLHMWDRHTPIDESLRAFDDLITAGKVRYAGCSNFLAYQVARSNGRAEVLGTARFDSVQPRYNLLFRENERELLQLCAEDGLAVIPYNPLAGGFLSGKHKPGAATEGSRFTLGTSGSMYQERYWHDRMFRVVDELKMLAGEAGVSLPTLAVQWVLANPAITSPIIGASRPDQLADVVAAAASPLDPGLKQRLDELTNEFRYGDAAR